MSDTIIDISEYKYSIKFLIEQGIICNTIEEITRYSEGRKSYDIKKISGEMNYYSGQLLDVYTLSKCRDKFYSYRQELIGRKQLILDDQSHVTRDISLIKKQSIIDYKVGKNDDGFKPSNDYERRAVIDGDLSSFQTCVETLDNHVNFIMESIKNISDMIYGFQFVIELEQYRKMS